MPIIRYPQIAPPIVSALTCSVAIRSPRISAVTYARKAKVKIPETVTTARSLNGSAIALGASAIAPSTARIARSRRFPPATHTPEISTASDTRSIAAAPNHTPSNTGTTADSSRREISSGRYRVRREPPPRAGIVIGVVAAACGAAMRMAAGDCGGRSRGRAIGARAAEDDIHPRDREAVALGARQRDLAPCRHVAHHPASLAYQVLMRADGVGIVAARAVIERDLAHLAHRAELVERVVDGGAADFRKQRHGALEHLLGGQMNVLAFERLGDGAPLRGHPDSAAAEPFEEGGRCPCFCRGFHSCFAPGIMPGIPIVTEAGLDSNASGFRISLNKD